MPQERHMAQSKVDSEREMVIEGDGERERGCAGKTVDKRES